MLVVCLYGVVWFLQFKGLGWRLLSPNVYLCCFLWPESRLENTCPECLLSGNVQQAAQLQRQASLLNFACYNFSYRVFQNERIFKWGLALTKTYIIWPLTLKSRSYKTTSCGQCTCNALAASSNSLGGDALTRKLYSLTLVPRSQEPSTSCDLCTCKVWSCYIQRLYTYEKCDNRAHRRTADRFGTKLTYLFYLNKRRG